MFEIDVVRNSVLVGSALLNREISGERIAWTHDPMPISRVGATVIHIAPVPKIRGIAVRLDAIPFGVLRVARICAMRPAEMEHWNCRHGCSMASSVSIV